jgi:hypothetical protein
MSVSWGDVCVWERSNIGIKISIANERNRQTYFGPLNSQIILREKDSVNLGWSGPSQIMGEKEFLAAVTPSQGIQPVYLPDTRLTLAPILYLHLLYFSHFV